MNIQLKRQTFGHDQNTSWIAGGAGKYNKKRVTQNLPAVAEVLSLVYKLDRRNYQPVTKVRLKCNISQVLKLWFKPHKVLYNQHGDEPMHVHVHAHTHAEYNDR
jgi:hypothetical protein